MANAFDPFSTNRFTPFAGPPPPVSDVVDTGAALDGAAASTDDLFAGLLELSWKEISFPYTKIRTEFRQDLAPHKFADRDGAFIEGTGRAPMQFTARVPLLNGLSAGINEHWSRPLYPFVRDNLLRACSDRSSGILQHPELGPITCKVSTMAWDLEAQVRSGVWVDFVWLESDDTGVDLEQDLAGPSPLANAQASAADLDQNLEILSVSAPETYVPPVSFSDMVNQIRGVIDTPALLKKQYAGQVDNVIYEANTLTASLNASASALNWPLLQSAERIKEAAFILKKTLLNKGRPIGIYAVMKDSTLAQVAAAMGANVMDVIALNTELASAPIVPRNATVRYYVKKAA